MTMTQTHIRIGVYWHCWNKRV